MSYVAVMPYEDYEAACDAIRIKTGTSDLIKSGEMAGLINGIENSGNTEIIDVNICNYTNLSMKIHYYSEDGYKCDSISAEYTGLTSVRALKRTIMIIELLFSSGGAIKFYYGNSTSEIGTIFQGYIISLGNHYAGMVVSETINNIEIHLSSVSSEPT